MIQSARNPVKVWHERGLALVEIMIAITVGLVLTAGVIQVFVSNKQIYRVQEALARLQENGRFAVDFLTRDVRGAGFLGCAGSTTTVVNTLNNASTFTWNFASPIQGSEATNATTWVPGLDATIVSPLGINALGPLGGNDVITVRHSVGSPVTVIGQAAGAPPGSQPVQVPPATGLNVSDVTMISDCTDGAIFQITGIAGNNLAHAAGAGAPGNTTKPFSKDYTNTADLVRLATTTYYVGTKATPSGPQPGLWRQDGAALAQELVEGVEGMQISYGLDTDAGIGDQVPNRYVTADQIAATDWTKVASVRVDLLLRTIDDNLADAPQPYTFNRAANLMPNPLDRRLRRVFTATIGLRNRTQ